MPARAFPPDALFPVAVVQQQALALGGNAFDFAFELFALAAGRAFLFLCGGGHAHGGQGAAIARNVAVQPLGQFAGVALVVVDAFVLLVQAHGLDHQVVDPQPHKSAGVSALPLFGPAGCTGRSRTWR